LTRLHDLKASVRALDSKIEASVKALDEKMEKKFDRLSEEITELRKEVVEVKLELVKNTTKVDHINDNYQDLRNVQKTQVWVIIGGFISLVTGLLAFFSKSIFFNNV